MVNTSGLIDELVKMMHPDSVYTCGWCADKTLLAVLQRNVYRSLSGALEAFDYRWSHGVAIEITEAVVGALRGELVATAVNAPMVPAEICIGTMHLVVDDVKDQDVKTKQNRVHA
ncbi:hypothetical protein Tco_1259435 [Tanacetum coccineum]